MHIICRTSAQDAIVGEIGVRHADEWSAWGLDFERQVSVSHITGPCQTFLRQYCICFGRECHDRRCPAADFFPGMLLKQIDRATYGRLLLGGTHVREEF